jgi:hypothetical protein
MSNKTLTKSYVNADGMLVYSGKVSEPVEIQELALDEALNATTGAYGLADILIYNAAGKKAKAEEEEEDGPEEEDEKDEWEDGEEEDEWDPDFDEFDLPKSTKKGKGGKDEEEEEDVKFDEDMNEFDDLFGDGGGNFDDDDDF